MPCSKIAKKLKADAFDFSLDETGRQNIPCTRLDKRNPIGRFCTDYFEEQKPLTQDLQGFFERGGRWVTAEELARSGVKRVMQRLPLGNP